MFFHFFSGQVKVHTLDSSIGIRARRKSGKIKGKAMAGQRPQKSPLHSMSGFYRHNYRVFVAESR
jgi:hypothetical protein